jgi:hypothetical protein
MNKIEVLKRECKMLAGKFPYESDKEGWKGKSYHRFAYDNKHVFCVHEDDEFIRDWEAKKIYKIKLELGDAGASFLNYSTREDVLEEARFERELEEVRNFVPKAVSLEDELA